MIRYPITLTDLTAEVDAEAPHWLSAAQKRTMLHIGAGKYTIDDPHWSAIKSVFMKMQHYKCIYCERRLESKEIGRIEHDLEHYRPKKKVAAWPPKNLASKFSYFTGGEMKNGYYWLGHDIRNYAASCKVCNTILKKNYFPTLAKRGSANKSADKLRAEKPAICYPIGDLDTDPRLLIKFDGIMAVPASSAQVNIRRADIIIEIFRLNDRDELLFGRSKMITLVGPYLQKESSGAATATDSGVVTHCMSSKAEHASCLADFIYTWRTDPARGEQILADCQSLFSI